METKESPEKKTETPKTEHVAVLEKNVTDVVLSRVKDMEEKSMLKIPPDYSAPNALRSAWLQLQDVTSSDKKPALEVCTKNSIANALLDMVVRGLNPMKNQVYFIVRGNKLCADPSYFGNMATAKRVGMKDITPEVIYEGDEFEYEINTDTGLKTLKGHVQKIENIDIKKIKGAYAVVTMEDGKKFLVLKTIAQIKQAWLQGATKGNSGAHNNFTDEMAKRTIVNVACKSIINSSNDSYLFAGGAEEEHEENTQEKKTADGETINFDDGEVQTPQVVETNIATEKRTEEAPTKEQEKTPDKTDPKAGTQVKANF